jgi:hypothetical protein
MSTSTLVLATSTVAADILFVSIGLAVFALILLTIWLLERV